MSSGRSERASSRHSAGLLLRVRRPDGHADEVYLAHNLTIGRSVANGIVLADDESVDRTHARVEVADDGTARLRCVEPDSTLTANGVAVRELPLDVGVRFRIGRAEFECVSGRRGAEGEPQRSWSTCPFCGSAAVPTTGEGTRPCPDCNNPVIPIPLDPHSPDPVLVPAAYGPYRGNRYVARGGMGLVLKGTREGGGEAVAIKVLLPGTISDRRDAERFEQEVAMLGRVRHPNVVKLLDHGTAGRCHYLVLEWVEGRSLREVIAQARREGKLPDFADIFRWFEQVCKGLAAMHAVGVVHRDLKPSNILIGPNGAARVADLGIAKRIDAGHTSYTTTGHAPGTFEYMAPEQFGAPDTVDGRADLYALGVTFYELLAGSRPVGAWRPASQANPTVPKGCDAILGRLLEPRPEHRYGDVYDLLSAISAMRHTTRASSGSPAGDLGRGIGAETRTADPFGRPLRIRLEGVVEWIRDFRRSFAGTEETPNISARNGAIWGGVILGMTGAILGVPICLIMAIINWDSTRLLTIFAWVGIGAGGGVLGGTVWGAVIGALGRKSHTIWRLRTSEVVSQVDESNQHRWARLRASGGEPPSRELRQLASGNQEVKGIIVDFNHEKGLGEIDVAGASDRRFFHIDEVVACDRHRIRPDARVSFLLGRDEEGRPKAVGVCVIGDGRVRRDEQVTGWVFRKPQR